MVEEQIAARGVRDPRVLDAMRTIPRDRFIPPEQEDRAYEDRALSIGQGQTISQPYIVAYMSETLGLGPDHRVLEIGTGSAYQTAILALLCRQVYSLERIASLSRAASRRLESLHLFGARLRVGDGSRGWPEEAPFDRIIVTAADREVPPALLEQLAIGGRLVMPVGPEDNQRLTLIERHPHCFIETPLIFVRFVPLIHDSTASAAVGVFDSA